MIHSFTISTSWVVYIVAMSIMWMGIGFGIFKTAHGIEWLIVSTIASLSLLIGYQATTTGLFTFITLLLYVLLISITVVRGLAVINLPFIQKTLLLDGIVGSFMLLGLYSGSIIPWMVSYVS